MFLAVLCVPDKDFCGQNVVLLQSILYYVRKMLNIVSDKCFYLSPRHAAPAPKLSRTPGAVNPQEELVPGQHTREVLTELGYTQKVRMH